MPSHLNASSPPLTVKEKDAFNRNMADNLVNMMTESSPFEPLPDLEPIPDLDTLPDAKMPSKLTGHEQLPELPPLLALPSDTIPSKPTSNLLTKKARTSDDNLTYKADSSTKPIKTQGIIDTFFAKSAKQRDDDIAFVNEHASVTNPFGIKYCRDQASTFLKRMTDASAAENFEEAGTQPTLYMLLFVKSISIT